MCSLKAKEPKVDVEGFTEVKPQKTSTRPAAKVLVALQGSERQSTSIDKAKLVNASSTSGALFFNTNKMNKLEAKENVLTGKAENKETYLTNKLKSKKTRLSKTS